MTKLKVLFATLVLGLGFGFMVTPVAAEEVTTEPVTEEVVEEEGFNYDDINELWTSIISWVGGISGLTALGMYGLRAWRERKTIGEIKNMIGTLKGEKTEDTVTVKQLKEAIGEFSVREERLEKVVISLIGLSNVTPEAKQEILKSIESPDVKISELLANKVEMIKQEVASKTEQEQEIVKETKSLLSKLAEKKE